LQLNPSLASSYDLKDSFKEVKDSTWDPRGRFNELKGSSLELKECFNSSKGCFGALKDAFSESKHSFGDLRDCCHELKESFIGPTDTFNEAERYRGCRGDCVNRLSKTKREADIKRLLRLYLFASLAFGFVRKYVRTA